MLNFRLCPLLRMMLVLTAVLTFSRFLCAYDGEIKPQHKRAPAPISGPLSSSTAKPRHQTTVFSGKIVDENGNPIPNVTVQVTGFGCKAGTCPDDLPCTSKCCDCRESPCKCCVDQKTETNAQGVYVVPSTSMGRYFDVRYMKDGKSEGTFAGIEVKPGDKRVTLNVQMENRVRPDD